MKNEIKLSDLLKQITPLPWPETPNHDDAPAFEHQPNWDYARHCANVLPELVELIDRIYRAALVSNAENPIKREWLVKQTKSALARAEKVKLP